jgi:DNA-binding response OmpR family regulator
MPPVVILLVERDRVLLESEKMLYEQRGYKVLSAQTRSRAEQLLSAEWAEVIVLGHSLTRHDREVLIAKSRLISPQTRILVVHASGAFQPVPPDAAVDSRDGIEQLFAAFDSLLGDKQVG